MIKKYFSIVTFVFITQFIYGQVNYGIKFGMNYSKVTVDHNFPEIEVANYNGNKLGFHIGVMLKIPVNKKLSFSTEILYSDKGSSNDLGSDTSYYEFNLYYINMPIIANYNIYKSLYIQLGIEPGYLSSINDDDYYQKIAKSYYNSFDLGALIGIEYYIKKIGIGLRYGQSIIPISDFEYRNQEGAMIGTSKSYNRNIQAYFTYLIRSN